MLDGAEMPESVRATGTDDVGAVALAVALTSGRRRPPESNGLNPVDLSDCVALVANALPAKDSRTKAGEQAGWLTGLEPATPRITI